MFSIFWERRRNECPDEPKYLSLCSVLNESGEVKKVITVLFDRYMVEGEDYDEHERDEMIKYLVKIAK